MNIFKLVIITAFFFISLIVKCQNLDYNDLKYLSDNSIEDADIFLTKKGFEIMEVKNENQFEKSHTWTYKRELNNSEKAEAFLSKDCYKTNCSFIWYQFKSVNTYNTIRDECKKDGYELINSEIGDSNQLVFEYSYNHYNITFQSGMDEENRTFYIIVLLKHST